MLYCKAHRILDPGSLRVSLFYRFFYGTRICTRCLVFKSEWVSWCTSGFVYMCFRIWYRRTDTGIAVHLLHSHGISRTWGQMGRGRCIWRSARFARMGVWLRYWWRGQVLNQKGGAMNYGAVCVVEMVCTDGWHGWNLQGYVEVLLEGRRDGTGWRGMDGAEIPEVLKDLLGSVCVE
jgi:hypothetical protein